VAKFQANARVRFTARFVKHKARHGAAWGDSYARMTGAVVNPDYRGYGGNVVVKWDATYSHPNGHETAELDSDLTATRRSNLGGTEKEIPMAKWHKTISGWASPALNCHVIKEEFWRPKRGRRYTWTLHCRGKEVGHHPLLADAKAHAEAGGASHFDGVDTFTLGELRAGQRYVLVDTRVPGGKQIGPIYTDLRKADAAAKRKGGHRKGFQVIDAAWYGGSSDQFDGVDTFGRQIQAANRVADGTGVSGGGLSFSGLFGRATR